MNSISGDPIDSIPTANGGGGGGVDLSNYLDIADPTQTQADTIPVFETTGSKRLKLTNYKAEFIDSRVTANTNSVATKADQTALNDHTGSTVLHANVGKSGQGTQAVALGDTAGFITQGARSVAVGYNAGRNNQGVQGVTLGHSAGMNNQGQDAIAIGYSAASQDQGAFAVAIGGNAATTGQGEFAIAIGRSAAAANQNARSICINATNNEITVNQQGFFVAPIRDLNTEVTGKVMCYDTTTKEVILRNPPVASSVIETTFDFDATANSVIFDDEHIYVQWIAGNAQLRWQRKDAYSGTVNAGLHLLQNTSSQITSSSFSANPSTLYWFSSGTTTRDNSFDIGTDIAVRCLCWISSGGTAIKPHYTIEIYGGGSNKRLFGVVRRHDH